MVIKKICIQCATAFSLKTQYNKKTFNQIESKCHFCNNKTFVREINFFENTMLKDKFGYPIYENDVLLNPFYGDFWTVKKENDKFIMQLNTNSLKNDINTSFCIVAHNKVIKRRFLPGLKFKKTIIHDKEGRNITFNEPQNISQCLKKLFKKIS